MQKPFKILLMMCVFCLCALAQEQKQENENAPIKLLSSPPANYTLRAKKNSVEGDVKLRIMFLFDGKIGDVIDITGKDKEKLSEYGLTANAIEAARKIKFIPARRNGKAISVVKVVVYNFTLF
jgi:outer membrane biosynthesis protein TonB